MASRYTPDELKIVVDSLNVLPSYLSKRFVLKHLLGWTDELIAENVRLKQEELDKEKIGDKTWR